MKWVQMNPHAPPWRRHCMTRIIYTERWFQTHTGMWRCERKWLVFQLSSREQGPQWDHIRRTLALYVAQYTLTVAIMTKLICMIMHGIPACCWIRPGEWYHNNYVACLESIPNPTADDIEARIICSAQASGDDIAIQLLELHVQWLPKCG